MGLGREQEVEIFKPPVYMPGAKVVCLKHIRNDGTYRGREVGDILVRKGDVGYVRDIGTFLQQFYIYAVEWIEPGTIVGMRGKELRPFVDAAAGAAAIPASASPAPVRPAPVSTAPVRPEGAMP